MEEFLHYHRRYAPRIEVVLARYSLMWLKVLQVQVELVLLVGDQPDVYLLTHGHIIHSKAVKSSTVGGLRTLCDFVCLYLFMSTSMEWIIEMWHTTGRNCTNHDISLTSCQYYLANILSVAIVNSELLS